MINYCFFHLARLVLSFCASGYTGFMTDAFNPKIIIFILALLSQYVGDNLSPQAQLSYGLMLVLVQLGWFSIVAFLFSSGKLKAWLYQYAHWIERASGLLLIMLSVKLVVESV
ncbi:Threonine efflux protein [Vibrio spartinae]|uniref:Threonine efflux protein n=1 Tax=Vibrio spartinae TaxID=1918945 RepID=A0A1N6M5R5_9VIBR|nr:Threonine efflux protein [Vibrio spartinae]